MQKNFIATKKKSQRNPCKMGKTAIGYFAQNSATKTILTMPLQKINDNFASLDI